jgi:hypothetical protein
MSHVLMRSTGGSVCLPDPATIMIDRADGGQLVVYPPRRVWDRTALSRDELTAWNLLVAAAAKAMLDVLPQLDGGCLNYWDAGNWAVNDAAPPVGAKAGPAHRVLHLHLCGRSRHSTDPSWAWGESPFFPRYDDRFAWSRGKRPLAAEECRAIVERTTVVLRETYGVFDALGIVTGSCADCGYPTPAGELSGDRCTACADAP